MASLDFAGVLEVCLEALNRLPNELVAVHLVLFVFTCLSRVVLTVALVSRRSPRRDRSWDALKRLPFGDSIGVVEGGTRCSAKSGRNWFQNNGLEDTFHIAGGEQ